MELGKVRVTQMGFGVTAASGCCVSVIPLRIPLGCWLNLATVLREYRLPLCCCAVWDWQWGVARWRGDVS